MKDINFNLLRDKAYEIAKNSGLYDEEVSDISYLILVIRELMEALKAYKIGNYTYENTTSYNILLNLKKLKNRGTPTFRKYFEIYIIDSFEDKLADTVIRLLSFAGYRNFNVVPECLKTIDIRNKSIPEHIFTMISKLSSNFYLPYRIDYCIKYIFNLCECLGIDILWHIDVKMSYNRLREYKHGKNF
jgi:hypothetical protein